MSLRTKLILLVLGASGFAAVVIGLAVYRVTEQAAWEAATEILRGAAQLNAERLLQPFRDMQADGRLLAGAPFGSPLQRRIAELPEERRGEARQRLETVFAGILSDNPHYTQARFLSLHGDAPELVRVNRRDGRPVPVPASRLQAKGQEPYMQPLFGSPAQDGYFSQVTLNREQGRVEEGAAPTLRYVHPVRGPDRSVIGAIVINADFEDLLRSVTPQLSDGHTVTLVTGTGDMMTFSQDREEPRLAFRHLDRNIVSKGVSAAHLMPDNVRRMQANALRTLPATQGQLALHVIAAAPTDLLLAASGKVLRVQMQLVVLCIVLALAVSLAGVRRGTRSLPLLRRLADQIDRQVRDGRPVRIADAEPDAPEDDVEALVYTVAEANNRLLEHGAFAYAVFMQAADAILTLDRDGTILNINPKGLEIFGYDSLTGRNIDLLIPPEISREHRELVRTTELGPRARRMSDGRDVAALRGDGTTIPVEIKLSRLRLGERDTIVVIAHDISDRKALEREQSALIASLTRAKEELERSNAELDKFAYVASHDLKAPLRVIDNASRWLEEDLQAFLDDDARESMALLRNRVARMERLLDDLLQHSRIGRGKTSGKKINGAELMGVIRDLVPLPEGFRIEVDDSLAGIELPRMPIQNVLLNLVSNAVKHHDRCDGTVRVSVADRGDSFVFTVADDGPGIPPEYHEQVFEMFTTLKPRDVVEGSGMGLAMVRKTVALAGGEVTLCSDGGRGCTFRVTWPAGPASGSNESEGEAA